MIEQTIMRQLEQYKSIYSELSSSLKWKVDKRSLMLIAAIYVTSSKEFNLESFLQLADYIKRELGFFSQLKSVTRYTTAATLDTMSNDSRAKFHQFIAIYEKLIEKGFKRNVYTYIAAGSLLKADFSRIDVYIQKAADIYKGMREHHFFLTSSEDYPLAAILALNDQHEKEIITHIEEYYNTLYQMGFSMGNDLQFLSHILALNPKHQVVEKAEKCLSLINILNDVQLKIKKAFYPYIGMLTYLETPEQESKLLKEITEELNNEKLFKAYKDVNFMMSVMFLMNRMTLLGDAAKTSLNTTIETILQAQQAAMIAGITAASAAAASSSCSS
jgi:hypothetical protein